MNIYTTYSPSHRVFFEKYFQPTIPNELNLISEEFDQVCQTGEWYSDNWEEACRNKVEFFLKICKENMGKEFIFSDVDVQFFGDIKDQLLLELEDYDIACQSDGIANNNNQAYCSGFFICKGNERTLSMFQSMVDEYKTEDQYTLNQHIHRCKHKFLSPLFYTVGYGMDSPRAWSPEDGFLLPDRILAHHANWTEGIKRKILLLDLVKSFYLWSKHSMRNGTQIRYSYEDRGNLFQIKAKKTTLVDKVFITHDKKLKEREDYLNETLPRLGFENTEWITCFESSDNLTSNPFMPYEYNEKMWDKKLLSVDIPAKRLSPSELSIALKHFHIYDTIRREKINTTLILEDDVIFYEEFSTLLDITIKELPEDWDLLFIGSGCDLSADNISEHTISSAEKISEHLYKISPCFAKCADSYLINLKAAEAFVENFQNISLPSDHMLSYMMNTLKMNCYWAEPSLTLQGSQNNHFETSITHSHGW